MTEVTTQPSERGSRIWIREELAERRSVVECNRHMLTSEHNFEYYMQHAYLYTDDATVTPGNVTGLLYLAKKYAIGGLETLCLTYPEDCLSPENACLILEHAHRFDEKDLCDKAYNIVLQHGDICFATDSFRHDCFDNVMKSGDLIIQPENAFKAATAWAESESGRKGRENSPKNLRSILGETVYGIPFISMEKDYYIDNVVPRGILTDAENVKIMSCFLCPEKDPSPFSRSSNEPSHFFPKSFQGVTMFKALRWTQTLR
ncbi:BTB/POZ domain-containing protein 6-A-like [Haliotis cracherodii]|uniref:BTB/POZ domain-containing protein 6-A-like n=1 Tax=Haliotis cracherodii TaxID=6455 RepID=UPI0039EA20C9